MTLFHPALNGFGPFQRTRGSVCSRYSRPLRQSAKQPQITAPGHSPSSARLRSTYDVIASIVSKFSGVASSLSTEKP